MGCTDGNRIVVVSGFVHRGHVGDPDFDLRAEAWSLALDQRMFGPRQLLVAFADANGRLTSLGHTDRIEPVVDALEAVVARFGLGATYAIAYCDELLESGPPPDDLAERFEHARAVVGRWGVELVDWMSCDDELFRSTWIATRDEPPWWAVPAGM